MNKWIILLILFVTIVMLNALLIVPLGKIILASSISWGIAFYQMSGVIIYFLVDAFWPL